MKGLGGEVSPLGIGSVRVPCKGKHGQLAYLDLDKVLFIPGWAKPYISGPTAAGRMSSCYSF